MLPRGQETPRALRDPGDTSWHVAAVGWGRRGHVRGFPQPHGAVGPAHDLIAGAVHELRQPADAAHEEAGVDVEEDDGGVAVGVPPVGDERGLAGGQGERDGLVPGPLLGTHPRVPPRLTRVKKVQKMVTELKAAM